nr:TetR/AcrR family transcriptional regulator [Rhodococcus sp. (in: high G+C Gram-positive bacteria)]
MTDALPQMLRTDAKENRDRILEVAREVFAAEGLDVSMREIARRADVGPATLYRRFPTKKDLVVEAFMDEFHMCRNIVRDGYADPDAWRGFRSVIEQLSELNAQNQGFTEAFIAEYPGTIDLVAHRREALRSFSLLARRAQEQGELRQDFVVDDLVLILMANRGLSAASPQERVRAARRFAALMIDSLRASPANGPLPAAPQLGAAAVFNQ